MPAPVPAPSPEVQIGDIMLKVQHFADETAEDARRQARAVIADAQVEAASIVSRARREAEEIAAQAAPQIAPEAVTNLCSAIEEFANTNRVLVDELVQLRQTLKGSYADTPISTTGHLSALPPTAG
jgi:regulator of protease activity HflC (stomatin/prohibitin superfamily)